jgi:hypothetical protein
VVGLGWPPEDLRTITVSIAIADGEVRIREDEVVTLTAAELEKLGISREELWWGFANVSELLPPASKEWRLAGNAPLQPSERRWTVTLTLQLSD